MTETSSRHRVGLAATIAGITALGGVGGLAAALPDAGPSVARVVVAEGKAVGLPVGVSSTVRDRNSAPVPGAGPFPRTSDPITTIF